MAAILKKTQSYPLWNNTTRFALTWGSTISYFMLLNRTLKYEYNPLRWYHRAAMLPIAMCVAGTITYGIDEYILRK
jgi:hypothetical protein